MEQRSLTLVEPGHLAWEPAPTPTAGPGEALARVLRCGVCGTDIHAMAGRQPFFSYPRRLGHELCVEIIEAPADSGLRPGDRAAVEPYYFCSRCPACLAGKTNCCTNLRVVGVHIDGGHIPLMTVPVDKLHPSKMLSPDLLALTEPLVIGAHAVERAVPAAGEPMVIMGMGPIGLACAMFARAAGANVSCVDLDETRLRFACERMKLGGPIPAGDGLADRLTQVYGQLPSNIIDATGNRRSMQACFDLCEHGGAVTMVGLFIGALQIDDPNFHRRELTLKASRGGLSTTFAAVIQHLEAGAIEPGAMITHRLRFDEAAEQLPGIHSQPGLMKAMIEYEHENY